MFFFHSYHSSENTWPWSTLSPIVFHQAYYIYHVDFTQLDNKKTQNFWMDTKSYFQTVYNTDFKGNEKHTKKLRNVIQDCPVIQTFNFEASQK